jgi:uncharacterized integral membrane protein (TIGR00698 family)
VTAWPGILLCTALAALALRACDLSWVEETLHLSPLLLVILVGMVWRTAAGLPAVVAPGVKVAQKPILRWAVAGLGFRLSLAELWKVGPPALAVVVVSSVAALSFGVLLARWFGISRKQGILLSVGGAICGASAVVAADTVVRGEKQETAYALGVITILGTIGIVLYPLLHHVFGFSDSLYAVWDGASLPEMAQVVAAGDMVSAAVAEHATVVKLARICLLAPVVCYFAWSLRAQRREAEPGAVKVPVVPWFLGAFLVFVAANSTGWLDPDLLRWLQRADLWLLCIGMSGVGLQMSVAELRTAGPRPLLVGALQWMFLSALSLGSAHAALRLWS